MNGFCSKCGKFLSTNEGIIQQGKDGNAEILCNVCIEIEQTFSNVINDLSVVSSIEFGIVQPGRSGAKFDVLVGFNNGKML